MKERRYLHFTIDTKRKFWSSAFDRLLEALAILECEHLVAIFVEIVFARNFHWKFSMAVIE